MEIYLPIAEVSMNVFVLLGLGAAIGLLSGMFGVGGGFLLTPLLIFIGMPPAVAVASPANQLVAASVSGVHRALAARQCRLQDGLRPAAGRPRRLGARGVAVHAAEADRPDRLAISLLYVVLLGDHRRADAGRERARAAAAAPPGGTAASCTAHLVHGLPLKMRFRKSQALHQRAAADRPRLRRSACSSAILGVGGGFVLVPAMIYMLGMPTAVVIGTSLFQIIFVAANVTFLQASTNRTVDVVLAMLLLVGGVVGAQIGTRFGTRLRGEQLRLLLALLVLAVAAKLAHDLTIRPASLFVITSEP